MQPRFTLSPPVLLFSCVRGVGKQRGSLLSDWRLPRAWVRDIDGYASKPTFHNYNLLAKLVVPWLPTYFLMVVETGIRAVTFFDTLGGTPL